MVQARPFEIDGVVVPGHYVIIADDVVLLQADYNIVAMKRDGKMYIATLEWEHDANATSIVNFFGLTNTFEGELIPYDLNNGDLIR